MNLIALILAAKAAATTPDDDFSRQLESNLLPDTHGHGLVHSLSRWAYDILDLFGLQHNPDLAIFLYSVIVLVIAIAIGLAFRWVLLTITRIVMSHYKSSFVTVLNKSHFLTRITALIPPLAYMIFLHLTYAQEAHLSLVLTKLTCIYIIFVSIRAATSFVNVVWSYFDARQNKRKLPLKSIAQLLNGLLWLIGVIIAIALLVNKSPATLLAGLGAFAAVLMLVFKDSILGVVASVQLSEEDALHVGDWIKVHGTEANGTVTEVNLSSVKVLNWDNTTTMLPPYSLISGSFTNYRSMQQSNARRIYRCYNIDCDSVRQLSEAELDRYRCIPFMSEWIDAQLKQKDKGLLAGDQSLAYGSIETNLGLLRAYLKMYLDANPDIDHNSLCMISTQQQTANGIPLYLYCFTATSAWAQYEAIQASVFEHVAAILQRFDLCAFEASSGRDTIAEGYLSAGHPESDLFGAPEPFFYRELNDQRQKPLDVNADTASAPHPEASADSSNASAASASDSSAGSSAK